MTRPAIDAGAPALPDGATDCHVHVFESARFPFADDAAYHPLPHECGSASDLAATLASHGVDRVVIVNPTSGYRDDLRCMLAALEHFGDRARGIARGPLATGARELARLKARGVAGFRVDLVGDGLPGDLDAFAALAARLADVGLVLDLQCEGDQFAAVAPLLKSIPVRVVVDHLGRPDVARGIAQPGFRALLAAVGEGRCWVKLSGAIRFSRRPPPHADADCYAARLVAEGGSARLVWGSDWPFLRSDRRVDYGPQVEQLARWIPDAGARARVLADTPAELFGFAR